MRLGYKYICNLSGYQLKRVFSFPDRRHFFILFFILDVLIFKLAVSHLYLLMECLVLNLKQFSHVFVQSVQVYSLTLMGSIMKI